MSSPYPVPPSATAEARALLADLRSLLDRADALIGRLADDDPTGMTYSRSADEPQRAAVPVDVQGFAPTGRRGTL
jgi:hypothetical protein